ncbi:hypothetical protein IWX76_000053 [Pedobacter sp. CAN_A7]|uniref:hypothetical protein n=1 Tax=Pedobacter sp. CAN_A7 TaxID=2787722 RepID=UPI0018C9EAE7
MTTGAQIATPKQTGGGGFNYEDKVGAYFLCCMLLQRNPFSADLGLIKRIDMQKGAGGWALDDYLVTLEHSGTEYRVGVSVKSNQQFSANVIYGAARDLLWEQRLQLNGREFDADRDYFCFAQPPLTGTVFPDLNTLIHLAREQDSADLEVNLNTPKYTSKEKLALYNSFTCPIGLDDAAGNPSLLPGEVLSRLIVLEFDFELVVSSSENDLLQFAAQLLGENPVSQAAQLYEKLQQICRDLRPKGGFIILPELLSELKVSFELREFPSFASDLEKIASTTQRNLSIIKTTIGQAYSIDRSALIADITTGFQTSACISILSPSGHGKTALAKLYVESIFAANTVLWLNSSYFEVDLQSRLALRHSVGALIDGNTKGSFFIVIDGLERFYADEQLQHLAMLLKDVEAAKGEFKLLFTCIDEDFDEVLLRLYGYGILQLDFAKIEIRNSGINLIGLAVHFPNMMDLLRNSDLKGLLSNIKILDSLSYAVTKSNASELAQISESEIIDFLWKKIVESGNNGMLYSHVAKSIAKLQAEQLRMGVSNSMIDPASASALTALGALDVIYEYEDYLYFQHDLYGDWARYKIIRSHSHEIKSFLLSIDIVSPLWTKAIRQYGIYLLEVKGSEQGWLNLYSLFDDQEAKEKIIKNILLESVIFGTGAKNNLQLLKDHLLSNSCVLLQRLLEVFLIKATTVNPNILKIASTLKKISLTQASVYNRIPAYAYWLAVLDFLFEHREMIIKDDFYHCARIARDWLLFTPEKTPGRKKMAILATDLSSIISNEKRYSYANKEWKEKAFEGLLLGYSEVPELTGEVIQKLAGRVEPPMRKTEPSPEMPRKSYRFREAKKWPDGPFVYPDDEFIEVCLNRGMLQKVFEVNSQLANEVMLAILIKAPVDDYYQYRGREDFDLNVPRNWSPAFYRRGPFFDFLNLDPIAALNGIIKLVDFATMQWCSQFEDGQQIPFVTLEFNGVSKKYYGDVSLFFWYRGIGVPPDSLVSALMAVERYLYETNEDSAKVEQCIELILDRSESLAFIGMLMSCGKAYPALFQGVLRSMLDVMQFYIWERHNIVSFHLEQYGLNSLPMEQAEEANEWNKIFHRVTALDDLMINQLLNHQGFRPIYEQITTKWEETLSKVRHRKNYDLFQDRLMSFFKPENYVVKPYKEGLFYYEYVEPGELTERMAPARKAIDDREISPSAFTLSQVLEKDQQMALTDAENLWELLEKLKDRNVKDWFNTLQTPLDSILGGYVLMLKFKKVWIDSHPDYYQTILDYTALTFGRIEKEEVKVSNFSVQYSWNIFVSDLIAYLWKDGDSLLIRKWITTVYTNLHPESVSRLFGTLGKQLGWNHELFVELQNFTLVYAKIDNLDPHDDRSDLKAALDDLSVRFVAGKLGKMAQKWESLRTVQLEKKQGRRRYGKKEDDLEVLRPGLDLGLLKFAYKQLPAGKLEEYSVVERAHIVFIWQQAFDQVIYQFGTTEDEAGEFDDFPGEFDIWVIRAVPGLMTEELGMDFFNHFAEPLLKFGYTCPHWVEIYCASMFHAHLDHEDRYDRFIPQWQRIVKYCLPHKNWKYRGGRSDRYLPLSLFFLEPGNMQVWDYDYSKFVIQASPAYKAFFGQKWNVPPVIKSCCRFVKTPSGKSLLKIGLLSIGLAVKYFQEISKTSIPDGAVRQPFYALDELVAFLSKIWETDQANIRADEAMFKSYKELVEFLVSLHDPVGIELQGLLLAK